MNKKTLRLEYLAKRNLLDVTEKLELEGEIKKRLFQNFDFSLKITSCFLPISSKKEIDTWGIFSEIKKTGGKIALTVWDFHSNLITHRLWTDETQISTNSFGIPEPSNGEFIPNEQIDIVIVPLLVADSFGNRVGYGKGVYDRMLASCSTKTIFIGLSLFELVERIEDVDVYDIPLTYCITPTKCIAFEK
jgi:5-formyltetrahydrofolate cyclo-ligase